MRDYPASAFRGCQPIFLSMQGTSIDRLRTYSVGSKDMAIDCVGDKIG